MRPSAAARSGRYGLLACLLLFAQVLVAAHAPHELFADEDRLSCVVCVLGHDLGGAMWPAQAALPGPTPGQLEPAVETPPVCDQKAAAYQARGPPSRG